MSNSNYNPKSALVEVEQGLLGVINKMTATLEKVPQTLDDINQQLIQLNKQVKEFNKYALQMAMKGENIPLKDKKLLEQARDVVENKIYPYIEANRRKVVEMKQDQKVNMSDIDKNTPKDPEVSSTRKLGR